MINILPLKSACKILRARDLVIKALSSRVSCQEVHRNSYRSLLDVREWDLLLSNTAPLCVVGWPAVAKLS